MSRASVRARHEAERRFPVRVRIAVPAQGLGRQLAVMQGWLDETCGAGGWEAAPAGTAGVINDAIALYFADIAFAHAFVARFCRGSRIETIDGALTVRADTLAARRSAATHKTP